MNSGVPAFSPLTSGFRVRHREYIQDVSSSIAFASQTFPLNPGMSTLFPWLSSVAQNFEEYKIHGLVVYLNTMSGVAISSINTALGMWGAVTQYDPTEPDFVNKQQAENYVGCQTTVPSNSLIHGVECMPRANVLDKFYVRTGAIADGEDLKFYDLGKIQIFTQGSQNVNIIGEMWVSYDVEFSKPRLPTGGANDVYSDKYYVPVVTAAAPLGVSSLPTAGSNLGTTVSASGLVINVPATAPATKYLLAIRWNNTTSITATAQTFTPGGSISSLPYFRNNVNSVELAPNSGVSSSLNFVSLYTFVKAGNVAGTITLASTPAFVVATADIFITQLSNTISIPMSLPGKLDEDEVLWLRRLLKKAKRDLADELLEESKEENDSLQITPIKDKRLSKDVLSFS
jgi:hypothetical protein